MEENVAEKLVNIEVVTPIPNYFYHSPVIADAQDITAMYKAWDEHCGDTLQALIVLKKNTDSHNWMVNIDDAGLATNHLLDLIEMSKYVPYNGIEVNMTSLVEMWFKVCPDNHFLADFFNT